MQEGNLLAGRRCEESTGATWVVSRCFGSGRDDRSGHRGARRVGCSLGESAVFVPAPGSTRWITVGAGLLTPRIYWLARTNAPVFNRPGQPVFQIVLEPGKSTLRAKCRAKSKLFSSHCFRSIFRSFGAPAERTWSVPTQDALRQPRSDHTYLNVIFFIRFTFRLNFR